ncbi:MAG: transporter substrate-binding domain-containing protein [Leptospirales bacterium]|nr:transporter substrate-binding domain-containing protein [Leptospirales bacterium]
MLKNKQMTHTILFAAIIMIIFSVCTKCTKSPEQQSGSLPKFTSFRDIPGITEDEIKAIEALQKQDISFVYGMPLSTEAFFGKDKKIKGFTAMFCEWLTELFEIPFIPKHYEWPDLLAGLKSGEVNFTGELTATEERLKTYYMTDGIAERTVDFYCIADKPSFSDIAATRPLRYAFLKNATTINNIISTLGDTPYELFFVRDFSHAYTMLKSGKIDAFFSENTDKAAFDIYDDVVGKHFFPPSFSPVSMSTQNPALKPIIDIVQKMLKNGGLDYLSEMYSNGNNEYLRHALATKLTEEERTYILNNPIIPYITQYNNYPMSFYNKNEKQWQGIAFELLHEIEELTGLSFKLAHDDKFINWPSLLEMLESGHVAFITDLMRTEERKGRFIWLDTTLTVEFLTLVSQSDRRSIRLDEVKNLTVGVIKNSAQTEEFMRWFPNHDKIIEYNDTRVAFDALGKGEVDLVMTSITNLLIMKNYIELIGYKANIIFDDSPLNATFGFNAKEVILRSIIDKALSLVDTKAISNDWKNRSFDYRYKLIEAQRPWLIGVAVLLLCVLILISILFQRNRNEGKRLENLVWNRTAELGEQHVLMSVINTTAMLLLESEAEHYLDALNQSMKIICKYMGVDRISLWQNNRKDDEKLYYKQICKWINKELALDEALLEFAYHDTLPNWEGRFLMGESINGPLDSFSERERSFLQTYSIHSLLAIPLFLEGDFWGFVSCDDCHRQRIFPPAEMHTLQSWGLLAIGAIERSRIALNMQHTLSKLEAIIRNYKGIIWSADNNRIITTFNGQYLKKLGLEPSFWEGKRIEEARLNSKPLDIEYIEKTFHDGPQDWIEDRESSTFHSYTTPIYDVLGNITGIVASTDDVTEIVKLQRELKTAVEVAKAASRSKSAFLANMSHEMRTPMNVIVGLTDLMLEEEDPSVNLKDNLKKISTAGNTLLGLINDVLDISKIEAGKLELMPVQYEMPSLLNDIITLNIIRIESKPITFRLDINEDLLCNLYGDDLRVKQIINNLLSNAFKYTQKGTVSLGINCEREGDENVLLSVWVSDTGIGIREEDLKKLFTDYNQVDTLANRRIEGTGLGLSITKMLVEHMNGEISVESEYGKGSTFRFHIRQKFVSDKVIGTETIENLRNFRYSDKRKRAHEKFVRPDLSYASVLVVDDMPNNLDVAKALLGKYKIRVDCIATGQEAINRIIAGEPIYDAIFMDHMMPVMDGVEATAKIRAIGTKYAKAIPIIALTANAIAGNEQMFLNNDFQAFLAKPINIMSLDSIVQRWVRDKSRE